VLDRFRFIPVRLLQSIPVVIGVTIVVFFMVHLLPGNPALTILGQSATPERVAALNKQLGLDKPLWDQYFLFVGRLAHGDLGDSLTYQRPVSRCPCWPSRWCCPWSSASRWPRSRRPRPAGCATWRCGCSP
jgi:ABC-type microcin C transport system permease subunit YejB